jgi:transcriptional regulator with XRE-family HTH domain
MVKTRRKCAALPSTRELLARDKRIRKAKTRIKVNGLRTRVQKCPGNPAGLATLWHGMSLRTIAKRTGIHLSTVSRIYNRVRRPSFAIAPALANALGITMEQLFIELNTTPRTHDARLAGHWRVGARADIIRDAKRLASLGRTSKAASEAASVEVQPDDLHAALVTGESTTNTSQLDPL